MKKFLFVFSFLSLFAMTQMQAQDKACCSIAPPTCCKISECKTDKTASIDATATTVKAEAATSCCPAWMQKLCKAAGKSCNTEGNAANTTTATTVAAKTATCCKKTSACQSKKQMKSEEL